MPDDVILEPGESVTVRAKPAETDPPDPPNGGITDTVNVRAFGAKGDGETDDTVAIQRAFDAGPGKCVLFDDRGPWKTTRKVLIKGPCLVMGYGGARLDWHGDGGLGIGDVGNIPYLRVEGLEINNQSGNHEAVGFGLNNLSNRFYDASPYHRIDVAVVLYNKFIRSKVLLNNGTQGRTWFNNNLVESRDLGLWPYVVGMMDEGNHNSSSDTVENGLWCCENIMRAVCARPTSGGFGQDSDFIKCTGSMSRVHLHGNKMTNLDPERVEAQIDVFTGGGRMLVTDNHIANINFHYKQNGGHGGMQAIDAYGGLTMHRNYLDWTNSHAGWYHNPAFIRGSGFVDVSHNFVNINTGGRQVTAFVFVNTAPREQTGLGSESPRHCTVIGNRIWLRGRNDHRMMDVQPSQSGGQPAHYAVHGNVIADPGGQSTPTADLRFLQHSTIVGNISPNSPRWSTGAGCQNIGNITK